MSNNIISKLAVRPLIMGTASGLHVIATEGLARYSPDHHQPYQLGSFSLRDPDPG
jgi:hypothetical protein